ncbi:hypothetical protein [Ekhidna sp.]|uniref:hypothetical protein n=1 Tax=Ekhidna sp. TaxID=2608089 RepID=UPI0032ED3F7B
MHRIIPNFLKKYEREASKTINLPGNSKWTYQDGKFTIGVKTPPLYGLTSEKIY